jgi:hypothetical protein
MDTIIYKLPIDVVNKIIPYTYNLQNVDLLDDIKNYKRTKTLLFELYHKYWIMDLNSDYLEDKNWLINDIISYANDYNATMFGYDEKFYNILKRNMSLQTKEKIDKYMENLYKKNVTTQISIFLGLLTINERNEVISNFIL